MKARYRAGVAALIVAIACRRVGAQAPVARSTIEAGASASAVDHGYGNWTSLYLRGSWTLDPSTVIQPEIVPSQQFHDRGTFIGLGATRVLNDDWYAFGAAATSAGGFYLPQFRGTAVLNRKLLSSRQLVLNVGASYANWKDAHTDLGISAGGAYYFAAPWIVEAGTTWNSSRPGNVASQSYFGAVTEGRNGSHYLILRAGGGREAYQVLSAGHSITDFSSNSISLTWRQWVTRGAGVTMAGERYTNPFYHRTGFSLGGFWSIK